MHRLDRDTSGLMMFAKSKGIQEQMQHNWHNMVLERKYVAVVEGQMEQPEGMVRSYLAENAAFQVYSTDNPEEGQLAITRYKVLSSNKHFSLVELNSGHGTEEPDPGAHARPGSQHCRRPQVWRPRQPAGSGGPARLQAALSPTR